LWVNPNARRGREVAARDELARVGIDVAYDASTSVSISEAIRERRDDVDMVVVGGGDGTLNSAAEGLIETGLPLGILPLGTANDLARTLDLPVDISQACEVIAAGGMRKVDVGQANDKYFFNVASIGLSVEIARSLDPETKRVWGAFAYAKTACRVAMNARPFWAEIRSAEGTSTMWTLQIAVGNGRYYGGGMAVADDAAIDDARLDLYSLECDRWWKLVWLAPAIWLGQHGRIRDVRTLAGQDFTVRTRRPLPVNADGEIVTRTPTRFRVHPAAISVFAPPQ
jgi:YegS/Rv2252/BmrU family lipid kinase